MSTRSHVLGGLDRNLAIVTRSVSEEMYKNETRSALAHFVSPVGTEGRKIDEFCGQAPEGRRETSRSLFHRPFGA